MKKIALLLLTMIVFANAEFHGLYIIADYDSYTKEIYYKLGNTKYQERIYEDGMIGITTRKKRLDAREELADKIIAMLKENGNVIRVSTFPLNCPYNLVASFDVIYLLNILFTVNESIFLLNDDIIELKVSGIDTFNIFFIIVVTFSCL